MANRGYIAGVDAMLEETSTTEVLRHFGQKPPEKDGGEHRMPCVFDAACAESSYGTLTVNLSDPAKRIYCHTCGVRGNLLTLLWGLEKHRPPTGGKLRGEEFKEAVALLRRIRNAPDRPEPPEREDAAAETTPSTRAAQPANVPLKDSENERARELVTLYEELVVDVEQMHPAAASYVRRRPWLTPDVARKWRMGYLPHSARGLLRGRIVYGYFDERDRVLSYFGRDPSFEKKWQRWERQGRAERDKPIKHRFVKGFHRGLELYGQHGRARLQDEGLRQALKSVGLVVVEGPNDVIRLDCLGIAAVGLCSNRATETQVAKIVHFARTVAGGKVVLLPDTDPEGEEGCKELLWALHQWEGVRPKLGWASTMDGQRWKDRQPESLSSGEWEELAARLG